jgi:predicted RNase H-like HicB family nuclease
MTRKQIKGQAARYAKFVEWSDEDKCFIGRCPELMLGGVHGHDAAKAYAELCAAVEEMIEVIHADGQEMPRSLGKKEFSSPFVVRVDPAIRRRLAVKAFSAGGQARQLLRQKAADGMRVKIPNAATLPGLRLDAGP